MNETKAAAAEPTFLQGLGLLDATMLVAGSMIGSGIFIVSADIARQVGSAGWLLAAWVVTGALTVSAALSYGELAAMMPRAGGQYVYLREAYSPLWGFLYGWTLFLVIQTGTIAAVGVAFARYLGSWPRRSRLTAWIIPPINLSADYARQPFDAAVGRDPDHRAAHVHQHARTASSASSSRTSSPRPRSLSLIALIVIGLLFATQRRGRHEPISADWWTPRGVTPDQAGFVLSSPPSRGGGRIRVVDRLLCRPGRFALFFRRLE